MSFCSGSGGFGGGKMFFARERRAARMVGELASECDSGDTCRKKESVAFKDGCMCAMIRRILGMSWR